MGARLKVECNLRGRAKIAPMYRNTFCRCAARSLPTRQAPRRLLGSAHARGKVCALLQVPVLQCRRGCMLSAPRRLPPSTVPPAVLQRSQWPAGTTKIHAWPQGMCVPDAPDWLALGWLSSSCSTPAAAPARASMTQKRASRDGRREEASNRLRMPIAAACCVSVGQRRFRCACSLSSDAEGHHVQVTRAGARAARAPLRRRQ